MGDYPICHRPSLSQWVDYLLPPSTLLHLRPAPRGQGHVRPLLDVVEPALSLSSSLAPTLDRKQIMPANHHRGRNVNWTLAEKNFLLELIERHTDTIENKRNDYSSLVQRAESWVDISKEFAVTFPRRRHLKRLREQYQRMKCTARKECAKFVDASEKGMRPREVSAIARRITRLAPADFVEFLSETETPDSIPCQTDAFFGSETGDSKVFTHSKKRLHDVSTVGLDSKSTKSEQEKPSPVACIENVNNELAGTNGRSGYPGHDDGWNLIKMESADASEYADQEPPGAKATISSRANKRATISSLPTDVSSSSKQQRVSSSGCRALTAVEKNQIALQELEHEVKAQHMETEHRLRLDIMRLQKRLLEKQLETLDKVSTRKMGSRVEVMPRSLLDSNSFGLGETYEFE